MEDATGLQQLIKGNKMNTERQPLLGHGVPLSDTDPLNSASTILPSPPHTSPRTPPGFGSSRSTTVDTALVNVQNDEDEEAESNESKESLTNNSSYNPAMHRTLEHPTSNIDTLIHLLKGNIGTGILAMPNAFKNSGLYVGLFGTLLMGVICTHCMHMLVKCSHELCRRMEVPSLSFSDVCFGAFETGPLGLRKYSSLARQAINIFLCITQLGFCCVYFVFVAVNLQEVIAHYFIKLDIRVYLLIMLIPMIVLNLLKNLKYLTPVSLFAAVLTVTGLSITFHYMLIDLPNSNSVNGYATWAQLPLYFGTAIYAFEGIGVVLPLENNMKTPQDFGGSTGVLNTGMVIVACLYTAIGFFGYLKYGDDVKGSVTLNLPSDDILAQSVRIMMALAIFLSYCLQFYVPVNIIAPWFNGFFQSTQSQRMSDISLRITLVVFTCILAAIVPDLENIISLVGAVSSSMLALIFPPIIEIITFWPHNLGEGKWVLWKDIGIMIIGLLGFLFGTYASVEKILNPEQQAV